MTSGKKARKLSRLRKEGAADEMEQYTTKMSWEARQQRLEEMSVSQRTFVERLCVSAEDEAKMLHPITEPTPWRGGASLFKIPEEDAETAAGILGQVQGGACSPACQGRSSISMLLVVGRWRKWTLVGD